MSELLQCKAALDSLRRDYEKQYMELTVLRVEVEALRKAVKGVKVG